MCFIVSTPNTHSSIYPPVWVIHDQMVATKQFLYQIPSHWNLSFSSPNPFHPLIHPLNFLRYRLDHNFLPLLSLVQYFLNRKPDYLSLSCIQPYNTEEHVPCLKFSRKTIAFNVYSLFNYLPAIRALYIYGGPSVTYTCILFSANPYTYLYPLLSFVKARAIWLLYFWITQLIPVVSLVALESLLMYHKCSMICRRRKNGPLSLKLQSETNKIALWG